MNTENGNSPPAGPPGTGKMTRAGLRGRCPRCGQGRLFQKYLKFTDACAVCGLGFTGHDVGDGPVVPAILVLGGILVDLALWLELSYQPPLWVHAALWGPLSIAATMAILPPLKGLSVALQYRYRSTEEEAEPGGS